MDSLTYYEILGVSRGASLEEIKTAYRKLMRVHHPDIGGDSIKAKQIGEAYNILKDGQKRFFYDQQITPPQTQPQAPPSYTNPANTQWEQQPAPSDDGASLVEEGKFWHFISALFGHLHPAIYMMFITDALYVVTRNLNIPTDILQNYALPIDIKGHVVWQITPSWIPRWDHFVSSHELIVAIVLWIAMFSAETQIRMFRLAFEVRWPLWAANMTLATFCAVVLTGELIFSRAFFPTIVSLWVIFTLLFTFAEALFYRLKWKIDFKTFLKVLTVVPEQSAK